MTVTVSPAAALRGTVALPPDKSVGHRTALLSALADGPSTIENYPGAADPQSTLACLRQLGAGVDARGSTVRVTGHGLRGLKAPDGPLDCGNSGTTMRLLAGILAGQPFESTLVGDASLSARPMARIAEPLRALGAEVTMTDGHAPLHIRGGDLKGITYRLPVASAQVKSCVLLAGLYAAGSTTVVEPVPCRDHTERMLGLDVLTIDGARHLTVHQGHAVPPQTWRVPADFSAAAFFLVAASIVPGSELHLEDVGLNPTRSALLDVLRAMGADCTVARERMVGGEPVGTITVRTADALHGVEVGGDVVPNLIDEIPVLAVAAARAEGRTVIRDAGELRVKETDRLAATATNLRALGAHVEEREDGLVIEGRAPLHGAALDSFDDHRIAMASAVAALTAEGPTTITDAECAAVSFPGFWDALDAVTSFSTTA